VAIMTIAGQPLKSWRVASKIAFADLENILATSI
jgi:hypothetical protein